ncbi:MAG TPA: AI-2E family transporter [Longimicrobiales bacterium]|nr:AI-2E family transporter [Longimicrobiales bacterium]
MGRRPYAVFVAAVAALLVLYFLYSIAQVLLLFFIGVLFAIYLSAVTDAIRTRLAVPRTAGLFLALLLTLVAGAAVLWVVVPPVVLQAQELITAMPALMARWEAELAAAADRSPMIGQVLGRLEEGQTYTGIVVAQIGTWFGDVVPYLFSGLTFLIHIISVLVMGIYLALRPGLYREGFILLAPPVHRELVRDILSDVGGTLRAWIVGQILGMTVLGVLTWIGLELLGVPYALAFGFFAGATAIVPFFGTLFSTALPALFVLGTGSITQTIWVLLLGVFVQTFEANVVSPMIMERQVKLPPVLSILAVLIMAHLLHLVGLFVAVPVLAVVMVVTRRVYVHRILEGKGFRRAVRDRPVELRLPEDGNVLVHPVAYDRSVAALLEN